MIWVAAAIGIAIIAAFVDSISTVIGLETSDTAYEQGPIASTLHQWFGLRTGQAIMFLIQVGFWIGGGWLIYQRTSLSLLTLLVGAYFGFAVRQLLVAYDARKLHESTDRPNREVDTR